MKLAIAATSQETKDFLSYLEPRYRITSWNQDNKDGLLISSLTVSDTVKDDYVVLVGMCKTYGIDINKKVKTRPNVYYRRSVAYLLVKRFGWSQGRAAKQLNYANHTSVFKAIKAMGKVEVNDIPLLTALKRCVEKLSGGRS